MKGTSIKVGLALVLFLVAGIGFWSNRSEATLEHGITAAQARLAQAIADGNVQKVAAILEDRPDLTNSDILGEPMLLCAARHNQPAVILYLLQHGADRNARGDYNATALHWACWWGAKEAAATLIAQGFAIEDRSDVFASTPLLWAAQGSTRHRSEVATRDYEATVRMLIEHGASADTYNRQGISAFSLASREVARVLLENGANPQSHPSTRPSRSGLTA